MSLPCQCLCNSSNTSDKQDSIAIVSSFSLLRISSFLNKGAISAILGSSWKISFFETIIDKEGSF